jgi:hypothetical protein
MEKRGVPRREAKWLEMHEAAVLLLAAKALPPRGGTRLDAGTIAKIRATWERGQASKLALARSMACPTFELPKYLRVKRAPPRSIKRGSLTR